MDITLTRIDHAICAGKNAEIRRRHDLNHEMEVAHC